MADYDLKFISGASKYDFEKCTTVKKPKGPMVKDDVAAALVFCEGNFRAMAKLLGRRRNRVYQHVMADPDLKDLYDEIQEEFLDEVEEGLRENIREGDPQDRRLYLQTRGKERGYSTRVEATGKEGGPIHVHLSGDDADL